MTYLGRLLIIALISYFPLTSMGLAPVVDDSENFALMDEEEALNDNLARNTSQWNNPSTDDNQVFDNEKPLAHEETILPQNQAELYNKVQGLQQDLQDLRGQLEMQIHEIKQLKEQQLAYYKDLDARMRHNSVESGRETNTNINLAPSAPAIEPQANNNLISAAITSTPTASNPADEQISYMAAYELIKNKQFEEALLAMTAFLNRYPNGGYTANAEYWLGELYMVKRNYSESIQHFNRVVNQFPRSSKAAASLLKIGYALAASGDIANAKQKLNQVVKNYPDTATAKLAAAKLKSLQAS